MSSVIFVLFLFFSGSLNDGSERNVNQTAYQCYTNCMLKLEILWKSYQDMKRVKLGRLLRSSSTTALSLSKT